MGLINFAQGGGVTIEIREGMDRYEGSLQNGVSSDAYGAWNASFIFIDANGNVAMPKHSSMTTIEFPAADWKNHCRSMGGETGATVLLGPASWRISRFCLGYRHLYQRLKHRNCCSACRPYYIQLRRLCHLKLLWELCTA